MTRTRGFRAMLAAAAASLAGLACGDAGARAAGDVGLARGKGTEAMRVVRDESAVEVAVRAGTAR